MTEDKMVRGHHQLNGHEFEQNLGVSEEQGSLVCCSLWGCRVGLDLGTGQQTTKTGVTECNPNKGILSPKHNGQLYLFMAHL